MGPKELKQVNYIYDLYPKVWSFFAQYPNQNLLSVTFGSQMVT